MSTATEVRPAAAPTGPPAHASRLHAERATAGLTLRQIWIGGLMVAASTGGLLWLGAEAYRKTQEAGGGVMVALADNPAVRAIYGLPTAIDTLGGFAVWRVNLFVTLVGTVLVTLATTRVLRGNEETGRLDLVLANPIPLVRTTGVILLTVLLVPLLATLVAGSLLQAEGAQASGAWLYAAGLGLLFATFVALAALTSQLVPERRRATGFALGVLFATMVLRVWADGAANAAWARWLSPFGWLEQLHAFGADDLLPLLPLVLVPAVLVVTSLVLAARRDTGAGMVRSADTKDAGTRLLSRPLAFATRRRIGELAVWGAGLAVLGLLSGGLAESLVGFGKTEPQAMAMLQKVGMGAAVTPAGFIAIMDVLAAVVLAGYAIACIHADYDDEISDRLALPYSNPVSRTGWAGPTVATTLAALVVLTCVLGLSTWLGGRAAHAGLSLGDCLAASTNVFVVPVVFLGIAVLLHGTVPAWTVGGTGILAFGLYMVDLVGPGLSWPGWLLDLSPYYHLTLVPAESAAWTALAVMLGIGVVAGAVGLVGYARRDLT